MTSLPTVYVKPDCPFCATLLGDLDAAGIAYTAVDVEQSPSASAEVERINGGNRIVPTVVFADGWTLTNPPVAEVAGRL